MPELLLGDPGQGVEGWELRVARRKAVHSYAEQGTLATMRGSQETARVP